MITHEDHQRPSLAVELTQINLDFFQTSWGRDNTLKELKEMCRIRFHTWMRQNNEYNDQFREFYSDIATMCSVDKAERIKEKLQAKIYHFRVHQNFLTDEQPVISALESYITYSKF